MFSALQVNSEACAYVARCSELFVSCAGCSCFLQSRHPQHYSYPLNGATLPRNHARAFVSAHIISGYILIAMSMTRLLLGPGDSFSEYPGCQHRISDNTSATEPATVIATLVLNTKTVELGVEGLTVIDHEYKEIDCKGTEKSCGNMGEKVCDACLVVY